MGPAHPGHCRGCGPLSPVGRSGGGSTGRPRSCVDEGERIMNGGAATAFLPNFVTFPSLRGLHSSTVQPWRTPRPHGVRRCVGAPTGSVPRRALVMGTRDPAPGAGPVQGMRSPRTRGSAAPCQPPPPPHPPPPPPQDDPPPQDEPPPQEWPEWCPPEDEPPPSPAHQLFVPPPLPPPPPVPVQRELLPPVVRTVREVRRPRTNTLITRAATTNRMMPVTTAPPSFPFPGHARKSPEAIPRWTPRCLSIASRSPSTASRSPSTACRPPSIACGSLADCLWIAP
ncbi:hypothetical protein SMCF_8383 [Streptomyces coelicoflavus ZG0656]|nr:hypothetical protein SMCF_8383 [Streptomyces coelicoflavus ZG0656]